MKQQGFSLIEILVSVVILALIALAIIAMLPKGYSQVREAGRLSVINHLGVKKIDEIKTLGYTDDDLLAGIHPTNALLIRLTDPEGYSLRWIVSDNVPETDMKTVVVEVGFMLFDTNGVALPNTQINQQEERFVTYISE